MGFSSRTKQEVVHFLPKDRCCLLGELAAYYDFNGYLMETGGYLDFNSSSPVAARRQLTLIRTLFPNVHTQIFVKRARLLKHQVFTIRISPATAAQNVFAELRQLPRLQKSPLVYRKKCCRRAYVRGAFLAHGSITNPERTYHLEISTDKTQVAGKVQAFVCSLGLDAKVVGRKGSRVVYLKEGEQIATFLNLIGAHQALLEFENVRVLKEMRNSINRLVNCETANVDKTVAAAVDQLEDIHRIDQLVGIDSLEPKLQSVANVRLANPYASLAELGSLMDPPMSKSGVNYRLKQLREMSKELTAH